MKDEVRTILEKQLEGLKSQGFEYFREWIASKHIESYEIEEEGEVFQIEIQAFWSKKGETIEVIGAIDYPQPKKFLSIQDEVTSTFLVSRT